VLKGVKVTEKCCKTTKNHFLKLKMIATYIHWLTGGLYHQSEHAKKKISTTSGGAFGSGSVHKTCIALDDLNNRKLLVKEKRLTLPQIQRMLLRTGGLSPQLDAKFELPSNASRKRKDIPR
jgi:hypothetical protein